MKEISQRINNTKLVMLGFGENKYLLKRLIRCFNLEDNVVLIGYEENVAKYMARAKVLVLCSEVEACPCALLESLAMGLPSVSVDCPGGIRELLSSKRVIREKPYTENTVLECGIITPQITIKKQEASRALLSKEEKLFAQGICMLLEDDELRKKLSKGSEKRAKRFDQDNIKKEWLNLLERNKHK